MYRLVNDYYLQNYSYRLLPLIEDEQGTIKTIEEGRAALKAICDQKIQELEEEIAYWKTVPNLPVKDKE